MKTEEFPGEPADKQVKDTLLKVESETYADFISWVSDNVPEKLQSKKWVVDIFKEVSSKREFQNIWDYEVSVPEKLPERVLISYSYLTIKKLGDLSGIHFNLGEINLSENILDAIRKIEHETKFLLIENESLSQQLTLLNDFTLQQIWNEKIALYLKQKIIIKKLQELLDILENYELKSEI